MGNTTKTYSSLENGGVMNITLEFQHNKCKYTLEVPINKGIAPFKQKIFQEIGVPVEFQIIIWRGKKIKEDNDLHNLNSGDKVLLMGESEKSNLIKF